MNIVLQGNYRIRDFLYGDALNLSKHASNTAISSKLRHNFPSPYTIEFARNWISNAKKYEKNKRFCIDYNGECIGDIGFVIGIGVYRFNAEIGYWLSEDHWGKGVMTKALHTVCKHAFENFNIIKLFADVQSRNKGSSRILEKCGFICEGVFRKHFYKDDLFLDQNVYGLLKSDFKQTV